MLHLGDITKIHGGEAPVVDVVIGGSPCQDLSIAGKRAGLAGVRGKEILPSPVDKSSRLVKDEEKASYDKLPLSLTEAVECAKKSAFLQNSPCKDIANRFIEVIEQEAM